MFLVVLLNSQQLQIMDREVVQLVHNAERRVNNKIIV